MAASGKKLDSKDSIIEIMPQSLVRMIPSGVTNIIYDYSFDAGDMDDKHNEKNSIWLKQPAMIYTFFEIPSSQKQILALAEYAGPLNQIEAYIRKAHARKETHLQATLMQAIKLAVIGLDQTICDEKGTEIDKGMAETLLELHEKLFPEMQSAALKQAQSAAPLENKEDKKAREDANVVMVDQ